MKVQSGFGRSFFLQLTKDTMNTVSHTMAHAVRAARAVGLFLTLLATAAAQAEPRPEAYGSVPDHYANVREALQARQWSTALDALQQLAREMPPVTDEAEFHNLTGFALRQHDAKRLATAIDHYLLALRIDPAHVQAREYLGQACLMQGRMDLALEQLHRIEHHCQGRACEAWQDLKTAIDTERRAAPADPSPPQPNRRGP